MLRNTVFLFGLLLVAKEDFVRLQDTPPSAVKCSNAMITVENYFLLFYNCMFFNSECDKLNLQQVSVLDFIL